MPQIEKITSIKNWLGRNGLQFLETLIQAEQERCNTMGGLIAILHNKFKTQYHETIKSLQYCKLVRQPKENEEE